MDIREMGLSFEEWCREMGEDYEALMEEIMEDRKTEE